jgi:hypothetical protein
LVENIPLDTQVIASLMSDREDLHLVWPKAKWPFDHDQWREVLDPDAGNKPFLVFEGEQLIGHAALRKTEESDVYSSGAIRHREIVCKEINISRQDIQPHGP